MGTNGEVEATRGQDGCMEFYPVFPHICNNLWEIILTTFKLLYVLVSQTQWEPINSDISQSCRNHLEDCSQVAFPSPICYPVFDSFGMLPKQKQGRDEEFKIRMFLLRSPAEQVVEDGVHISGQPRFSGV